MDYVKRITRSPIVRLLFAYRSPTVRLLFAYCSPIVRLDIAFPIGHLAWDDSPESWQKHTICPFL